MAVRGAAPGGAARALLLLAWLAAAAAAAAARAPPQCPAAARDRCQYLGKGDGRDEYLYNINGVTQTVAHGDGIFSSGYYSTRCGGAALDDPAQPRFLPNVTVSEVRLWGCAPPAAGAYADALRALGVTPEAVRRLELYSLDAAPPPRALQGLPRLYSLGLQGANLSAVPLPPSLDWVTVEGLAERELAAWPGCSDSKLTTLFLFDGALERLGAGWLRGCGRLSWLSMSGYPKLRALPSGALDGVEELRRLAVRRTALEALPEDLFVHTPLLSDVDLSGNRLKALAGGVFAPLVRSLQVLKLARNPLGPLCARGGPSSPLGALRALTHLDLSGVGARWLCADWLHNLTRLETLDLTNNDITNITLAELLLLRREAASELDLTDNPLRLVGTAAQYERAAAAASVRLPPLPCDCHAYWPRRALAARLVPAAVHARCERGPALVDADPESLRCALPAPACPAGCACADVPHASGLEYACSAWPAQLAPPAGRALVRLRLAGAGLRALPDVPPGNLTLLDLRNNSISGDGAAAAGARLLAGGAALLLAANPLRCGCEPDDLLAALRARRAQLRDRAEARCADGRPLERALAEDPCARAVALPDGAVAPLAADAPPRGAVAPLAVDAPPRGAVAPLAADAPPRGAVAPLAADAPPRGAACACGVASRECECSAPPPAWPAWLSRLRITVELDAAGAP